MADPTRRARGSLPALALVLTIGCAAGSGREPAPGVAAGPEAPPGTGAPLGREASMGTQERPAPRVSPSGFATARVIIGDDTIQVELARTGAERSQGLMNRPEVPPGTGMLFVFPDEEVRSFWMQNTLVSLDIAFLDAELAIVDIQQMEARSTEFHDSRAPAMYALEVPAGWLAAHGIRVGDRAQLIPDP